MNCEVFNWLCCVGRKKILYLNWYLSFHYGSPMVSKFYVFVCLLKLVVFYWNTRTGLERNIKLCFRAEMESNYTSTKLQNERTRRQKVLIADWWEVLLVKWLQYLVKTERFKKKNWQDHNSLLIFFELRKKEESRKHWIKRSGGPYLSCLGHQCLVQPKLILLIILSIWHHGSKIHT